MEDPEWEPLRTVLGIGKKRVDFLMNDVHYYIPQVPSCPNASFYVSGLQFEQTPGRYLLPCGEGEYSIYTDPSDPMSQ